MIKYSFRNDYSDVGNPIILEELSKHYGIQYTGYGSDTITKELLELVRDKTKHNVDIYLFSGGTQTNMTLLSKVLQNYEAVISHSEGHINVHETGAVEGAGKKIIPVEGKNGKVYPEDVITQWGGASLVSCQQSRGVLVVLHSCQCWVLWGFVFEKLLCCNLNLWFHD